MTAKAEGCTPAERRHARTSAPKLVGFGRKARAGAGSEDDKMTGTWRLLVEERRLDEVLSLPDQAEFVIVLVHVFSYSAWCLLISVFWAGHCSHTHKWHAQTTIFDDGVPSSTLKFISVCRDAFVSPTQHTCLDPRGTEQERAEVIR